MRGVGNQIAAGVKQRAGEIKTLPDVNRRRTVLERRAHLLRNSHEQPAHDFEAHRIDFGADGAGGGACQLELECLSAAGGQLGGHVGYPPLPAYTLLPAAQGGTLLADGPIAIAYRRELARQTEPCGVGITNRDRRLRAAWLERLVDGIEVEPEPAVAIDYGDGSEFAAAVERSQAEFHARRRRLFSALAAAGALTPAEVVAANRPLRLLVRDGREPGGPPLPSLGGGVVVRELLPIERAG